MTILEQAAALLQEHALCDDCLGRQFAKLGHGLTNTERGKALRVALCMIEKNALTSTDLCPLCLNHFAKIDAWVARAIELVDGYDFTHYLMGTRVPGFIQENERDMQREHKLRHAEHFNQSFNRTVGRAFGETIIAQRGVEVEVDFRNPDLVVNLDLTWDKATVDINPLYVFGRYRKLIRGIPQTHWPCKHCKGKGCEECSGTGQQYPNSVESYIGRPLNQRCEGEEYVLHGAGREDIDALMLGSGRPFVIEIKKPKKRLFDWDDIVSFINESAEGKVEVEGLQTVKGNMVGHVKEKKAEKCYRVRVEFDGSVDAETLEQAMSAVVGPIEQQTPQRVAHRRADLVRKRELFSMSGQLLSETSAEIDLHCSGGLYVKELISGDEGRTEPSLSAKLGFGALVTELDVVDILGDFL
jgi:tRNA pseudouridine synthase 10